MTTISSVAQPTTGFFVDWNGDTRRVERPGFGYTCSPVRDAAVEGQPYQAVDVADSGGFVVHTAVYYPTLSSLAAVGVDINLVD